MPRISVKALGAVLAASLLALTAPAEAGRPFHSNSSGHSSVSGHHGTSGHPSLRGHSSVRHHSGFYARHGLRGHSRFGHGSRFSHRGRSGHGTGFGSGHGGLRFGHHGAGSVSAAIAGVGAALLLHRSLERTSRHRQSATASHVTSRPQQPRRRAVPSPSPPRAIFGRTEEPRRPAFDRREIATSSRGGDCLQTREYQTTITIGGEEREAFGTACLTRDGSWRMGPPQPAERR